MKMTSLPIHCPHLQIRMSFQFNGSQLEQTSESLDILVKTQISGLQPTVDAWGKAQELVFLTNRR
jgi:hypothetical protein